MDSREKYSQIESSQVELSLIPQKPRLSQDQLDEKHENEPSATDIEDGSRFVEKEKQPLVGGSPSSDEEKIEITVEPRASVSNRRRLSRWNHAFQHNIVLDVLWPIAYAGLQLHDIYQFSRFPETRFGYQGYHLALGSFGTLPSNPFLLSTSLTTARVGEFAYWAPAAGIVGAAGMVFLMSPYYPLYRPTLSSHTDSVRLARIKKGASLIRAFYVNYSFLRLLEILLGKSINIIKDFRNKKACDDAGKAYVFITYLAENSCTFCGDWQDLGLVQDPRSAQQCLDVLLAKPRSTADIQQKLSRLKQSSFTAVRLNHQPWGNWSATERQAVFQNFIAAHDGMLEEVDLSTNFPIEIDEKVATDVGDFLRGMNAPRVKLNDLPLGNYTTIITNRLLPDTRLEEIDLSNTQSNSDVSTALFNHSRNSNLQRVHLQDNLIDEKGVSLLQNISLPLPLAEIDLASNPLTAEGALSLIKSARQSNIKHIRISKISLNDEGILQEIGQAIVDSQLTSIAFIECNLGDRGLFILSPYLAVSHLKRVDFSKNGIGDDGIQSVEKWPANLELLNLSENELSDDSLGVLCKSFFGNTVKELNLRNNDISGENIPFLAQLIKNARVKILRLFGYLDDGDISNFCNAFDPTSELEEFILDNSEMTSVGMKNLTDTFKNSRVKAMTVRASQIDALPDTGLDFERMDFSNNPRLLEPAVSRLLRSNTQEVALPTVSSSDEDLESVTKSLTNYPASLNDLRGEIRYPTSLLIANTNLTTSLNRLSLNASAVSPAAGQPLFQLLPRTHLNISSLQLSQPAENFVSSYSQNAASVSLLASTLIPGLTLLLILYKLYRTYQLKKRCKSRPTSSGLYKSKLKKEDRSEQKSKLLSPTIKP